MKKSRLLSFVFSLALVSSMPVLSVRAETIQQDGLTISLTTDKEQYASSDEITANFQVTNNNQGSVYEIQLDNIIPDGYAIAEHSSKTKILSELKAGETVELKSIFAKKNNNSNGSIVLTSNVVSENNSSQTNRGTGSTTSSSNNSFTSSSSNNNSVSNSPATGNDDIIAYVLAALSSATLIIATKKGRGKRMFSFILCGTMLLSVIPITGFKVSAIDDRTAEVTINVKVDDEVVPVTSTVKYSFVGEKEEEANPAGEFFLRADKDSVFVDEAPNVHVYLETDLDVPAISLWYGKEGETTNTISMYDNGTGADDIAGDGVYSASINDIDITEDTTIYFVAKYDDISSNEVVIKYYLPISDEVFDAMDIVDQGIDALLSDPIFEMKTDDEKIASIKDMLIDFEQRGLIMEGSIFVDEANKLVSFMYLDEILGGVSYKKFESDKNGMDIFNSESGAEEETAIPVKEDAIKDSSLVVEISGNEVSVSNSEDVAEEESAVLAENDTEVTENLTEDTIAEDEFVTETISEAETKNDEEAENSAFNEVENKISVIEATEEIAYPERFVDETAVYPVSKNVLAFSGTTEEIGTAIILNSFPTFETKQENIDFRTDFYETLETSWDNAGLDTTLLVNPTVNNYKSLDDYNVVCISTHGDRYSWNDGWFWSNHHEVSAICLAEKANGSKNKEYKAELKGKQIAKVNSYYYILPSFFEQQYDSDAFSDSFIFSECCMSMGTGEGSISANYDYTMPNVFVGRSAKAYIGFHNSVLARYSREFMEEYVNRLIVGDTSKQAFDSANSLLGANHAVWYQREVGITLQEDYQQRTPPETFDSLVDVAYPVHNGNENAVLITKGIQNGGFEQSNLITTKPKMWDCLGDVRTITKLADISTSTLSSSKMAIVTSGIGAQTSAKFENGTEGSSLSQTFIVPDDATTISFDYNFISEEPMEYVGSRYDDSFVVQIFSGDTLSYDHTYESINNSEWKEANGVNFISGDDTAYQTGWKSAEIDVSAYKGKKITLSFIIFDVGDTSYDSAVLVDNVIVE